MTTDQYVTRFSALVEGDESIKVGDVTKHVPNAVRLGLEAFWGAWSWSFRTYEYTMTLTSAEAQALPDDTDIVQDAREETTTTGYQLQYFTKEDFDRNVPKISWHSSSTPQAYTVYEDSLTGKKMIKFWPPAQGSESLYLTIFRTAPDDCSGVPEKFGAALDASIARFVYPYGHPGRADASIEFQKQFLRAQVIDKKKDSRMTVFPTSDSRTLNVERPWL